MYRQLTVPLTPPPPVRANPIGRMYDDLRAERAATVPFPPGLTNVNLRRASRFSRQPLPVLLACYERYGPVFTIRVFHSNDVFMLGPEANHYITVSHASNFSWRHGFMGDLIPLLGDGLLTIDGEFHRASRKIMLPAFHHERIEAAHAIMAAETTIHGHAACTKRLEDDSAFREIDTAAELPGGVTAHRIGRPRRYELPLYLPGRRALAFGDAVVGVDGALRVWIQSPLTDKRLRWYRERFLPTLEPLRALDVDEVLVTHGDPVLSDGGRALADALDREPWYHRPS